MLYATEPKLMHCNIETENACEKPSHPESQSFGEKSGQDGPLRCAARAANRGITARAGLAYFIWDHLHQTLTTKAFLQGALTALGSGDSFWVRLDEFEVF